MQEYNDEEEYYFKSDDDENKDLEQSLYSQIHFGYTTGNYNLKYVLFRLLLMPKKIDLQVYRSRYTLVDFISENKSDKEDKEDLLHLKESKEAEQKSKKLKRKLKQDSKRDEHKVKKRKSENNEQNKQSKVKVNSKKKKKNIVERSGPPSRPNVSSADLLEIEDSITNEELLKRILDSLPGLFFWKISIRCTCIMIVIAIINRRHYFSSFLSSML